MAKEIRILGRVLTCGQNGWALEADPNLIEAAVQKLGLDKAKGVASPGVKRESPQAGCDIRARRAMAQLVDDPDGQWPGADTSPPLDHSGTKLYQSVAALMNFVAMDRPDLLFSTKEVMKFIRRHGSIEKNY